MDVMKNLFPDIDPDFASLQVNDSLPSADSSSVDDAEPQCIDLTLSIVTSRIKKTELRLRNMKHALAGELNLEKRERLKSGIAEYEIRLDELKIIERAAVK